MVTVTGIGVGADQHLAPIIAKKVEERNDYSLVVIRI